MQGSPSSGTVGRVCVQLLDSSNGSVIQTWQFDGLTSITIGRSSECHVRVGNQHVSRLHAELKEVEGDWMIVSHGRHGMIINGERLEQAPLKDRTSFRLGGEGPVLSVRFEMASSDSLATLDTNVLPLVDVRIDKDRKDREVAEITGADYFQQLRSKAHKLRQQRT